MIQLIELLTTFFYIAIFARVILTWFPIQRDNLFVQLIFAVTEPILGPIRRFVPTIGYIDISPMIALILVLVVRSIVIGALR